MIKIHLFTMFSTITGIKAMQIQISAKYLQKYWWK